MVLFIPSSMSTYAMNLITKMIILYSRQEGSIVCATLNEIYRKIYFSADFINTRNSNPALNVFKMIWLKFSKKRRDLALAIHKMHIIWTNL